jgi:hypothetical protein
MGVRRAQVKGRDPDRAIAEYGKVIQQNPRHPAVWKGRAEGYLRKHEQDRAIAD